MQDVQDGEEKNNPISIARQIIYLKSIVAILIVAMIIGGFVIFNLNNDIKTLTKVNNNYYNELEASINDASYEISDLEDRTDTIESTVSDFEGVLIDMGY